MCVLYTCIMMAYCVYRIYGEKAVDIIEGMKKSPAVGIPPVLKR